LGQVFERPLRKRPRRAIMATVSPTRSNRRAIRFFDPGNYDIYPPQVQKRTAETGDGTEQQAVHAE